MRLISGIVLALALTQAAEPTLEALRAAAQQRMRDDRQRYSVDEIRAIETLYQSANRDLGAPGARGRLEQLIKEYPASNRAGCALLYLARQSAGAEREAKLKQAIASHSDARYGDGTQVGAFARALLAAYYARNGKLDEARKLAAEVQSRFPGAVDHAGLRLSETLRKMQLIGG